MPELPEVETVRRALLLKLKGRTIKEITILHNNVFENQDIIHHNHFSDSSTNMQLWLSSHTVLLD